MAISIERAKLVCLDGTQIRVVEDRGAERINYDGIITGVPSLSGRDEEFAMVSGRKVGTETSMQPLGKIKLESIFLIEKEESEDDDPSASTELPRSIGRIKRKPDSPYFSD